MSNPLAGKVVAITGGARGIGFATAKALIAAGASVAIGDVDKVTLDASSEKLGKLATDGTDRVAHQYLDVTDLESFESFLRHVEESLGPIDVLINNAGIMPVGQIVDEDLAVTRRMFDINVLGVITGTKLAVQRMLPRKQGQVINLASLAGELTMPGLSTYCASKHAVLGFSDSVRKELRGTGVTVSSVLPTLTNTQLTAGTAGMKGVRNAEPEDIAAAIVRLVSHPEPRVRVTKLAGVLVQSQRVLPRAAFESISRLLGADTQFTNDIDTTVRAAYEDRARHRS